MSFTVRFTPEAKDDLVLLLEKELNAAEDALEAIKKGIEFFRDFPFSCRKILPENPFLRELMVPFGNSGYVALFEIQEKRTVTILAVRHQREDDYY